VIDLHLHTTASDGRSSPGRLVEEAAAAGLTTMAVTDHDTVAATADIAGLCASRGIRAVSGIEITAIRDGRDVHVLGYFLDVAHDGLLAFLARQRLDRIARVEAIGHVLASAGLVVDLAPLLEDARRQSGRSIGRPQIARALVDAGHVADTREAFDVWLAEGRPAFVPRTGASPERVVEIIHAARGLASLAHPGTTAIDGDIAALRDAGLDALEAYHSDHLPEDRDRYLALARSLDLLVTGGSDYHGDPAHGLAPGSVTLPEEEWARLVAKVNHE
jgi:predicted metal-dependent phosphoesterase TrpH